MAPWDGCSKPAIMRRVVVFPQPEAKQREELALCDRQVNCVDCNVPPKRFQTSINLTAAGSSFIRYARRSGWREIFKAWNVGKSCAASLDADTAPFR